MSDWLWLQPWMRTQEAQAVSVDAVRLPRENAPTRVTRELVNIEDVQLGRRVVGRNPLREQTQHPSDIHPETHRTVRLKMNQHGTLYELAFVRSLIWLDEQQAEVGGMIHLVMTEMGLDGPAHVVSIDPCPELEPDDGAGRMVVTGTMKHLAGNVLEIQTADDAEPLGVTDTHPIWSVDRQDFVIAGLLTVGEALEQADGTLTRITRITPTRGPPVIVYNLEIDGEHVFCVGEDGVLVHNSCPDGAGGDLPPLKPIHELDPKTLNFWNKKSTNEILDSLKPGRPESLKTYTDGRILNGHHRLEILKGRGIDINALPREIRDPMGGLGLPPGID